MVWYMTNGFQGTDVSSVTLYNTSITGENSDKMYVPAGTHTFTLSTNGDGTLTLSTDGSGSGQGTDPTEPAETRTIQFTDNKDWGNVHAYAFNDGGIFTHMDNLIGQCEIVVASDVQRQVGIILDVGHLHGGRKRLAGVGECRDIDTHPRGVGDVALEFDIGADDDIPVGHGKLVIGLSITLGFADSDIICHVGDLVANLAISVGG